MEKNKDMKNLIPYEIFEGKVEDRKEKILKQKIMKYFEKKYLDKFTSEIGQVVNTWLENQNINRIYEYSDIKLNKEIYPVIDDLIIKKMKKNDQFQKLFLDK